MLVTTTGADPSAQIFGAEVKPAGASPPGATPSSDPALDAMDSVSLSPAAQQVLAGQATPPADGPAAPDSAALMHAADLLNDTTGKVAVADQLSAFALLSGFVANGANFDAPKDLTTTIVAGAALYDSAFARQQQHLLDAVNSRMLDAHDTATAKSLQDALTVFNGFSAREQEIYLGAINLQAQTAAGTPTSAPAFASVDSYRANLQAQVDVHSAVEAAQAQPADAANLATPPLMALFGTSPQSDAWTQKAQAYFAQFGPAPPPDPKADHVW
ncbi:MAG TPA: hypothetical protein VGH86_01810, partial [Phenylobacterium sp.]